MSTLLFEKFDGADVTDDMLVKASQLFNENYGIWAQNTAKSGAFAKPVLGSRVRLNKDRLRAQCLARGASCSYARVIVDERFAGNVFACRWTYNGKIVCWVTQLVVHHDFRERGLAVGLLIHIRHNKDEVYGIMSSHPAACLAATKAFGHGISTLRPEYIRKHAEAVMKASPVDYVKDADRRGSFFDAGETEGAVSSVNTNFFVDHTEPLETLARVRAEQEWPLGELLDGHEFLLLLESKR